MTAEAALMTRTWPVGAYTVTLTLQQLKPGSIVHATAEWAPTEPSRLSTDEWREYRLGRNAALAELAAQLGISVAVLEL